MSKVKRNRKSKAKKVLKVKIGPAGAFLKIKVDRRSKTKLSTGKNITKVKRVTRKKKLAGLPPPQQIQQGVPETKTSKPEATQVSQVTAPPTQTIHQPQKGTKSEQPSNNPHLSNLQFEDIFYNRETQSSACEILMQKKMQQIKNGYSPTAVHNLNSPGDGMKLRSSDPQPAKIDSLLAAGGGETDESAPGPANVGQGGMMVEELLSRYTKNKGLKKNGGVEKVKKKYDDEFDWTELDFEDEIDTTPNGKDDFLKYSIPQWELKEKLLEKHINTIQNVNPSEVANICMDLLPELKKIMTEEVESKRHEIFKLTGLSKQTLRDMTITKPFSPAQDTRVVNTIDRNLLSEFKQSENEFVGELLHYNMLVLVPEALIRIYALVNDIPVDLAEKELRYGAGYDGFLPEDLIKSVDDEMDSNGQVNKENVI